MREGGMVHMLYFFIIQVVGDQLVKYFGGDDTFFMIFCKNLWTFSYARCRKTRDLNLDNFSYIRVKLIVGPEH